MSAITVGGDLVHYEVLGRGRPVVLIHGWIGSWRYWIPVMRQLQLKYRVYAVDLFGFGDSSKNPEKYAIVHQVEMLEEFMQQLGVPRAAIIAHGLGAHVVVEYSKKYAHRIARLLIASGPLFDTGDLETRTPADIAENKKVLLTQPKTLNTLENDVSDKTVPSRSVGMPSKDVPAVGNEDQTIQSGAAIDRSLLRQAALSQGLSTAQNIVQSPLAESTSPPMDFSKKTNLLQSALSGALDDLLLKCFKKSEPEHDKLHADVIKSDSDVLEHVTKDFDPNEMLDSVRRLSMPTVIVHGEIDPLIPAPSEAVWNYISLENEQNLLVMPLPEVRHFPMLEHEPFMRLLGLFLENPDVNRIQVKDRWKRRAR